MIHTKIIATLGPATRSPEGIGGLIDAGVDVFRLNFSHGTLEEHAETLNNIRRVAAEKKAMVAVLGDLCGPKIRLDKIENGAIELHPGDVLRIQREEVVGNAERVSCNYPAIVDDADVGHRIFIDDGSVRLRVDRKHADHLECRCDIGGSISNHKGINLPDTQVSASTLTEKDRADLDWAIANHLDFIALSFVRRPEDIRELRLILNGRECNAKIVAKIEKPEALERIDEIIRLSDVILIARGDLGVEMDLARVPTIQKAIAVKCRRAGKPVIVATQMLQTMVDSPVPTRAEASDVANAILDLADAVMLSAETAIGKYPLRVIKTMQDIAFETERYDFRMNPEVEVNRSTRFPSASAIVRAAALVAQEIDAKLVAVWCDRGDTPRLLSKHRLRMPVVALIPLEIKCRQAAILYGTTAICRPQPRHVDDIVNQLDEVLTEHELAQLGDRIVIVADSRPDLPGDTDAVLLHTVGSQYEEEQDQE